MIGNKKEKTKRHDPFANEKEKAQVFYDNFKEGSLKEEIAQAIEAVRPLESVDDDVYKQESDGESKISRISNKSDETNQLINKLAINKLIEELDVRSKRIIVLRYFREKTQTEVAKMLGISQVQVSRIEKKVLISMREKMNC